MIWKKPAPQFARRVPVFRKDHAQTASQGAMALPVEAIARWKPDMSSMA
jgi:hypothetical protein